MIQHVRDLRRQPIPLTPRVHRELFAGSVFDEAITGESSMQDESRRVDYLPTRDEIARVCSEIKSGWTLHERRRRFVGEYQPEEGEALTWMPPVVDTAFFRQANNLGDITR